jgi:hypothetical protein
MKKRYNKFNNFLGNKLSFSLSTMEMFYIVLILVVFPLFFQTPQNLIGWIQYISTAILQAIALPLLGYTTRKSGEKQEKVINDTHAILLKEIKANRELHKQQIEMINTNKEYHQQQIEFMKEIKEIHLLMLKKENYTKPKGK